MQASLLLQKPLTDVESYESQWAKLKQTSKGLQTILEVINEPSSAIIFSHDDPDGITSGLIFKRTLQKKGWNVKHIMPEGFLLQKEQFEQALKETPNAKAVFMLDKGTLPPYNELAERLPIYIVDHHPTPQTPDKCVWFNPAIPHYVQCSASILAHGISYLAGTRDEFDDFLCLVGLKGDWAIEPVSGTIADFAKPFFASFALRPFEALFTLKNERPTMFDATQRTHTCLISRISEFVHATGGGGFSYFYNDRDEALKNVNHPLCIADALEAIANKINEIKSISSLDEFIKLLPEEKQTLLNKIWCYFLQDWNLAENMLDSATKVCVLKDTAVYLFIGQKVPLLPMVGSIKLFDLKSKGSEKFAQIVMISAVSNDYTHVSVRGTGSEVHSGKFCAELQDSLHAQYPEYKQFVSGGGHPVAAECTIKTGKIHLLVVIRQVASTLSLMVAYDRIISPYSLAEQDTKRALKLGLDYVVQRNH